MAVADPLDKVKGPKATWPVLVEAISEISPVGVPEPDVTVTGTLKLWPEVTVVPLGVPSVVVVDARETVLHFVRRFPTLMEPRPVAKSYFFEALNAGVPLSAVGHVAPPFALEVGVQISTPKPLEVVLLQFSVPATHATELLPLVTSLNTQAELGVCPTDDWQLLPV